MVFFGLVAIFVVFVALGLVVGEWEELSEFERMERVVVVFLSDRRRLLGVLNLLGKRWTKDAEKMIIATFSDASSNVLSSFVVTLIHPHSKQNQKLFSKRTKPLDLKKQKKE